MVSRVFYGVLVFLGLGILALAARKTEVWKKWDAEQLAKVGSGEATNERMGSLEMFFDTEIGRQIKSGGESVAILGRADMPPHEKNFSFPIYLNWFLVPEKRGVDLLLEPEAAADYRWVFSYNNSLRMLEKTGLSVEEVWKEGKVFVYHVNTRLEDVRLEDTSHKTDINRQEREK